MLRVLENKENCKTVSVTSNYSDEELIFKDLCLKCQTLENEKIKKIRIRQELLYLNEKNENITKGLLEIKKEFEIYKSDLKKTLFNLRVSADKQKILSQKKLDEFSKKSQRFQEYVNVSPKKFELEKLLIKNHHLQQELESKVEFLKLTKRQYDGLKCFIIQTFQKKVCEFCDVVLRSNQ